MCGFTANPSSTETPEPTAPAVPSAPSAPPTPPNPAVPAADGRAGQGAGAYRALGGEERDGLVWAAGVLRR